MQYENTALNWQTKTRFRSSKSTLGPSLCVFPLMEFTFAWSSPVTEMLSGRASLTVLWFGAKLCMFGVTRKKLPDINHERYGRYHLTKPDSADCGSHSRSSRWTMKSPASLISLLCLIIPRGGRSGQNMFFKLVWVISWQNNIKCHEKRLPERQNTFKTGHLCTALKPRAAQQL